MNCGGGSFKSQLKRADKSGATWALVLGDKETEERVVGLKSLRADRETGAAQETLAWDRLADGLERSPSELNQGVAETPPSPGTVAQSFLSLWSWDNATHRWYFYAPSLEASGGLDAVKAEAEARGYLDFATEGKRLDLNSGFWVNSTTTNPTSNLVPLGQAQAMISESGRPGKKATMLRAMVAIQAGTSPFRGRRA